MEIFREAVPEDSRREEGGAAVPAGGSQKTAERKRLEQAFCRKIGKELAGFKKKVLRISKEEIYALAYRIDCMIRIYEILAERSTEMEDRELACCLREKKLLWSLYLGWLKAPAPGEEELEYSLSSGIEEICREAEREQKGRNTEEQQISKTEGTESPLVPEAADHEKISEPEERKNTDGKTRSDKKSVS